MRNIGCLGDVVFTVSSSAIKTIQNATWSHSARYAKHDIHLGNTIPEFTGCDQDGFTFDIEFSPFLGTDPMSEIKKLLGYERRGVPVPLVIGDHAYGKSLWVITKTQVKLSHFDRDGNVIWAKASVTLADYT